MENALNVLLQCDDNYAPFAGVMLTSLFMNNTDINDINVYFLSMRISEENRKKFVSLVEQYGRNIKFIDTAILDSFLQNKSVAKWRGSYIAYYKIFALPMIDDDMERMIYIDSDVIVNGSLADLVNVNLDNNILGMCIDVISENYKSRLHHNAPLYYNSGVIVFDVNKWKTGNCTEKIVEHIDNVQSKYPMPDQDLLNLVFSGKIKTLPQIYNLHAGLLVYEDYKFIKDIYGVRNWYQEHEWIDAKKNAVILHCMGGICERPWVEGSDHPAQKLWNRYLKQSLWLDFVPVKQKMDFSLKLMRILFQFLPHGLYAFLYRNILFVLQRLKWEKLGGGAMEDKVKGKTIARNMMWHSAGSFLSLFSQWLITILVVRLSGNYSYAGTLSLATSITAVFSVIGSYSVRNYQVSDITGIFSDSEYVFHRIIFCLIANVMLVLFLVIKSYDMQTTAVIFAYMMYRNCSMIADVFAGIAQKHWRMDINGVSMGVRAVFELLVFCIIVYFVKNLLAAILGITVIAVLCVVLIDISGVRKLNKIVVKGSADAVRRLTEACFPMFCHGILANIMAAIPKVYLEERYGEELLGYYTSVANPAVVVQIAASYIFSPLIPVFSDYYRKKDKRFILLFFKIIAILMLVGITALIVSYFLGDWLLALVFGKSILKYSYLFISTIALSLTTAVSWFIEMLLVVMRSNKYLILGGVGGVIVCVALTVVVIPDRSIDGINIVNISATLVQVVIFCTGMFVEIRKKWKAEKN